MTLSYSRYSWALTTCKLNKEMMITRGSGKSEAAKQLEEICQMNKKNHQRQHQQKEEENKQKKDEAEAA